jgi:hypothetical protein
MLYTAHGISSGDKIIAHPFVIRQGE